MDKESTSRRILREALLLFAREGYEAVTVEQIANAVGIKAPSLYKHYKSKRDIFEGILRMMEQRDAENAEACSVPEQPADAAPDTYVHTKVEDLVRFARLQFRYWTEDEIASAFRRMLTVEQYRSPEMNQLYHQYLGAGPLAYTADLLGTREEAVLLYGPMHLLYSVYDQAEEKAAVLALLDKHLARWNG